MHHFHEVCIKRYFTAYGESPECPYRHLSLRNSIFPLLPTYLVRFCPLLVKWSGNTSTKSTLHFAPPSAAPVADHVDLTSPQRTPPQLPPPPPPISPVRGSPLAVDTPITRPSSSPFRIPRCPAGRRGPHCRATLHASRILVEVHGWRGEDEDFRDPSPPQIPASAPALYIPPPSERELILIWCRRHNAKVDVRVYKVGDFANSDFQYQLCGKVNCR